MIGATIFLVLFAIVGGVALYLSKTIEHGEARFDSSGKVISDDASAPKGEVKPATKIEASAAKDDKSE